MGSGCCKGKVPRESVEVDDMTVLEVEPSFPKDTIAAGRKQFYLPFDLLSNRVEISKIFGKITFIFNKRQIVQLPLRPVILSFLVHLL